MIRHFFFIILQVSIFKARYQITPILSFCKMKYIKKQYPLKHLKTTTTKEMEIKKCFWESLISMSKIYIDLNLTEKCYTSNQKYHHMQISNFGCWLVFWIDCELCNINLQTPTHICPFRMHNIRINAFIIGKLNVQLMGLMCYLLWFGSI